MTHPLYANFLNDTEQYAASERHWETLAHNIANSLQGPLDWKPWIPRTSPNGTPVERDGNPIFDARSVALDRAFRVIQHAPTSKKIEIAAWIKTYDDYEELPRHELILNLSLSEESSQIAENILRRWMNPKTTPAELSLIIANELSPQKKP